MTMKTQPIKPMELNEFPCIYLAEGNVHIKNITPTERQNMMTNRTGYVIKYYPIPEFQEAQNQERVTLDAQEIATVAKLQLIDHR